MPTRCYRHHRNAMRVWYRGLPWCVAKSADAAAKQLATEPACRGVEEIV